MTTPHQVESYLGDVIGELPPMRMPYRRRYEPFDWIVNIKHVVAATAGVTFWAALFIALLVSMFLAVKPALAHGPAEWIQEEHRKNAVGELCCGERDCGEFYDGKIATTPNGYRIDGFFRIVHSTLGTTTSVEVHELIPYSEATPSPDDRFWRCAWGGARKCFFAPPGAT